VVEIPELRAKFKQAITLKTPAKGLSDGGDPPGIAYTLRVYPGAPAHPQNG